MDEEGLIDQACQAFGIAVEHIGKEDYTVPLGFLAYGSQEDKKPYHREFGNEELERPTMLLSALTDQRLQEFLGYLRSQQVPSVGLKAMLTEYNAEGDVYALYQELEKEEAYFREKMRSEN